MSEIESKRRPFKWDFPFGNKKQSAGAKFGEYGGWSSTVTFRWVKKCLTIVTLWHEAFSCKRNHSPDSHKPGLTRRILFRNLPITTFQYTALIFPPSGTNYLWIMPCQSKKITNMFFTRDFWNRKLLGRGEVSATHAAEWRLVVGS